MPEAKEFLEFYREHKQRGIPDRHILRLWKERELKPVVTPKEIPEEGFLERLARGVAAGAARYPLPSAVREWLKERAPEYEYGVITPEMLGELVAEAPAFAAAELVTRGMATPALMARFPAIARLAERGIGRFAITTPPRAVAGATYGVLTKGEEPVLKRMAEEAAVWTTVFPAAEWLVRRPLRVIKALRKRPTRRVREEIIEETLKSERPAIEEAAKTLAAPRPAEEIIPPLREPFRAIPFEVPPEIENILATPPFLHTAEEKIILKEWLKERIAPKVTRQDIYRILTKPAFLRTAEERALIRGIPEIREFSPSPALPPRRKGRKKKIKKP